MPLDYDPGASNPANYIVDEMHNTTLSNAVWPDEGVIFSQDFEITAYNVDFPAGKVLEEFVDYAFSAPYVTYSMATGKEVYAFIILVIPEWDNVEITYRAVGSEDGIDHHDATIEQQVADAQPFDMLESSNWLNFDGQVGGMAIAALDPDARNLTPLEVLNLKLQKIQTIMETQTTLTPAMQLDLNNRLAAIATMEQRIMGLDPDLIAYQSGFVRHIQLLPADNHQYTLDPELDYGKRCIFTPETPGDPIEVIVPPGMGLGWTTYIILDKTSTSTLHVTNGGNVAVTIFNPDNAFYGINVPRRRLRIDADYEDDYTIRGPNIA